MDKYLDRVKIVAFLITLNMTTPEIIIYEKNYKIFSEVKSYSHDFQDNKKLL